MALVLARGVVPSLVESTARVCFYPLWLCIFWPWKKPTMTGASHVARLARRTRSVCLESAAQVTLLSKYLQVHISSLFL